MFRSAKSFRRGILHLSLLLSVFSAMLLCVAGPSLAAGYEFLEFGQGVNQVMSSFPSELDGIVINDFLGLLFPVLNL